MNYSHKPLDAFRKTAASLDDFIKNKFNDDANGDYNWLKSTITDLKSLVSSKIRLNDNAALITEKKLLERHDETKSRSYVNEKEHIALFSEACENISLDLLQHSNEASIDEDIGAKLIGM